MWPFKRRNQFANEVINQIKERNLWWLSLLREARAASSLTEYEYCALAFVTNGAFALAWSFIADKSSPLEDIRRQDLVDSDAPGAAYITLVGSMFFALKNVMLNQPEVAQAVGTSYEHLIAKFAVAIDLEDNEEALASWVSYLDAIEESAPLRAYHQIIEDFLERLVGNPLGLDRSRFSKKVASGSSGMRNLLVDMGHQHIFIQVLAHNTSLLRNNLGLHSDTTRQS